MTGTGLRAVDSLLFDLDGTLVDTIPLILYSFRETFRILGLPPRSDRELLLQIGRPLQEQARDIDPGRAGDIFDLYQRVYDDNYQHLVGEYPGVREAIAELKRRGYRLAVVTSKRRCNAARDLEMFGLAPYFEVLVAAEDTKNHKPDPDPVLKALEGLRIAPREAAFIGDSPYDVRSAHAAGLPAGVVGWGPFPKEVLREASPDYWIPEPQGLLRLFPGSGARTRG